MIKAIILLFAFGLFSMTSADEMIPISEQPPTGQPPVPAPTGMMTPTGMPPSGIDSPTAMPPSAQPILLPNTPRNNCLQDIELRHTVGITEVDVTKAVEILKQDTSTVTVRLHQAWTLPDTTVDRIFYTYRQDVFNQKCHTAEDVGGWTAFKDITMQCFKTAPFAELEICVADSGGALHPEGDDAHISPCCHADFPHFTPTVCYKVSISCESVCADEPMAHRGLRGGTRQ